MRSELVDAAAAVLDQIDRTVMRRPLTQPETQRLVALAVFAVRARSAVARDGYTQDVLAVPVPEAPPRFALALRRLLGGLEAIGVPDDDAWQVLAQVAVDSMPAARQQLLATLLDTTGPTRTATLATAARLPTRTAHRVLEDLALLRLADRSKTSDSANAPDLWSASEWTRRYWPAEYARDSGDAA